jgi:hypothetical protein
MTCRSLSSKYEVGHAWDLLIIAVLQESDVGVGGDVMSRQGDAEDKEQMQKVSSPQ